MTLRDRVQDVLFWWHPHRLTAELVARSVNETPPPAELENVRAVLDEHFALAPGVYGLRRIA